VGIDVHTFFVKMFYLVLPYFSNSLDIVNPVTNIDEINAIINVCSKVKPISKTVSAMLPDTSGEKNDTPKLPKIRAAIFFNIRLLYNQRI
jgi:hypothetical protein|tara:strand:- start:419 stop:688 length:270 start_codon:yes stop_codon:yes gene_type:complete